jgi:ubiquinone/menaquinone biosynthesis C-methylase UbiE
LKCLTDVLAGRGPTAMYEDYWVPRTLWPFAVSLAEVISPGDNVLDVGAGTGLLTDLAAARAGAAGRVTALDPTPFMQEILHRKYDGAPRIELVDAGIVEANLPEHSFDKILCHQVVQYLPDLPKAIAVLRGLLKPGGTLAIGVWSGPVEQQVSPLEDGFRRHLGESFAPIHAWSFGGLSRLEELAKQAGLTVEQLEIQKRKCRFASLEELVFVHIAGGMRFQDDEVLMGIFDLSDASYEPKVEALISELRGSLGQFESPAGFDVEFSSDVLVAGA